MVVALKGCEDDTVAIASGHNHWVLGRTDRDGASKEDVLQTASAFLHRVLNAASPPGQRGVFDILPIPETNETRYIMGAARPLTIRAVQPKSQSEALDFAVPRGRLLARFSECPTVRSLRADQPWIVVADFDWRAPSKRIAWPERALDPFGLPFDNPTSLDWLLLAASFQGPVQEPDTNFEEEFSKGARKKLQNALKPSGGLVAGFVIAGVLGLTAWHVSSKRKRKGGA